MLQPLSPWSRAHTLQLLSLCVLKVHALQCTEKPTLCNARRSPRSAMQEEAHALQCKEKPTLCNARRSPHAATTERPHSATKTQGSQKKKKPQGSQKKKHRQIWLLMRALLLASEGPVSRPHLAEISVFLFLCFSPLFLYGHQSHHESPILMT